MNRIPLRQLTGLLVGFILLCCMGDLQAIPRGKMFSGSEQRVLQVELHMKDQPLKSVFNGKPIIPSFTIIRWWM